MTKHYVLYSDLLHLKYFRIFAYKTIKKSLEKLQQWTDNESAQSSACTFIVFLTICAPRIPNKLLTWEVSKGVG